MAGRAELEYYACLDRYFRIPRDTLLLPNTARIYVDVMRFGHWNDATKSVVIDEPTLQGGILAVYCILPARYSTWRLSRLLHW